MYICFVEIKKKIDTVKHDLLVETLRRFCVDGVNNKNIVILGAKRGGKGGR